MTKRESPTQSPAGSRRQGRVRAFEILFSFLFDPPENDQKALERTVDTLEHMPASDEDLASRPIKKMTNKDDDSLEKEYGEELVLGVWTNREYLDTIIASHSQHWKISRIARTDLTLLRLAVFEMLKREVPLKVAINEAVEMAKIYGDDTSSAFVNGILDAIAKAIDRGEFKTKKSL